MIKITIEHILPRDSGSVAGNTRVKFRQHSVGRMYVSDLPLHGKVEHTFGLDVNDTVIVEVMS